MPPRAETSRIGTPRASRSRKGQDAGDPADPRNIIKPLKELAGVPELNEEDESTKLGRSVNTLDSAITARPQPFWDPLAIKAVTISVIIGAILGIPIGLFLYERFH